MVPDRPLVRRFMPALVALSAIAVIVASASDSYAATKKKKKPKPRPPAAAPAVVPPKPVETPEAPSTTSDAWGGVPLPPGMAPPPVAKPAPPQPVAPAAPVAPPVTTIAKPPVAAPGQYTIAIIVEGTSARDLDRELRKAFDSTVTIASPSQVAEAVTPKEQRIFDKPPNKRDLGRAMKRVAKKGGLDGVIYANVGGSTKEGYTANVLLLYRTGKIGVDASVPISRTVRQRGRTVLRWEYSNVSDLIAPGIDGLAELPPPGENAPATTPDQQGASSLGESLATFDANRGVTPTTGEATFGVTQAAPPEEEDEGPAESIFQRRLTSPLIVKVGIEGGHRQFAYTQPITSNLRNYSVGMAPLAAIEVEAYPFGTTSVPVLKNIGWYASYAMAFGLQSSFKTADAGEALKVNNNWTTWQVGLHSRFPIGRHFALGPQITYGFLNYGFNFKDATDQRAFEVPDVRYNFLRVGLEGRVPVWILDLSVGTGWSSVLTGGRVASTYFPNSQTGLVDAYVTLGLPIASRFALDGSVRYQRYFYDMRPTIGDTYVAGGAIDQYITASLSFVYLMDAKHE